MDSYYKLRQLFYYKVWHSLLQIARRVLQSAMNLLQIATGITKCDDYYKLRQYGVGWRLILNSEAKMPLAGQVQKASRTVFEMPQ